MEHDTVQKLIVASQEIPLVLCNRKDITVFTRIRHSHQNEMHSFKNFWLQIGHTSALGKFCCRSSL